MTRFIESLKNKPGPVKKLSALIISGAIACLVAGFALYTLINNIHKLQDKHEDNGKAVIVDEKSDFEKIKEMLGFAKSEIATSSSEIKQIFNTALATSSASSTDSHLQATSTATTSKKIASSTASSTTISTKKTTGKRK